MSTSTSQTTPTNKRKRTGYNEEDFNESTRNALQALNSISSGSSSSSSSSSSKKIVVHEDAISRTEPFDDRVPIDYKEITKKWNSIKTEFEHIVVFPPIPKKKKPKDVEHSELFGRVKSIRKTLRGWIDNYPAKGSASSYHIFNSTTDKRFHGEWKDYAHMLTHVKERNRVIAVEDQRTVESRTRDFYYYVQYVWERLLYIRELAERLLAYKELIYCYDAMGIFIGSIEEYLTVRDIMRLLNKRIVDPGSARSTGYGEYVETLIEIQEYLATFEMKRERFIKLTSSIDNMVFGNELYSSGSAEDMILRQRRVDAYKAVNNNKEPPYQTLDSEWIQFTIEKLEALARYKAEKLPTPKSNSLQLVGFFYEHFRMWNGSGTPSEFYLYQNRVGRSMFTEDEASWIYYLNPSLYNRKYQIRMSYPRPGLLSEARELYDIAEKRKEWFEKSGKTIAGAEYANMPQITAKYLEVMAENGRAVKGVKNKKKSTKSVTDEELILGVRTGFYIFGAFRQAIRIDDRPPEDIAHDERSAAERAELKKKKLEEDESGVIVIDDDDEDVDEDGKDNEEYIPSDEEDDDNSSSSETDGEREEDIEEELIEVEKNTIEELDTFNNTTINNVFRAFVYLLLDKKWAHLRSASDHRPTTERSDEQIRYDNQAICYARCLATYYHLLIHACTVYYNSSGTNVEISECEKIEGALDIVLRELPSDTRTFESALNEQQRDLIVKFENVSIDPVNEVNEIDNLLSKNTEYATQPAKKEKKKKKKPEIFLPSSSYRVKERTDDSDDDAEADDVDDEEEEEEEGDGLAEDEDTEDEDEVKQDGLTQPREDEFYVVGDILIRIKLTITTFVPGIINGIVTSVRWTPKLVYDDLDLRVRFKDMYKLEFQVFDTVEYQMVEVLSHTGFKDKISSELTLPLSGFRIPSITTKRWEDKAKNVKTGLIEIRTMVKQMVGIDQESQLHELLGIELDEVKKIILERKKRIAASKKGQMEIGAHLCIPHDDDDNVILLLQTLTF